MAGIAEISDFCEIFREKMRIGSAGFPGPKIYLQLILAEDRFWGRIFVDPDTIFVLAIMEG